jgi:hypothetical protein
MKLFIIASIICFSVLQANAQCSTTPNNFEIRLHQSKAQQINIAIRYNDALQTKSVLPDVNLMMDGLVFAFSWPTTSSNIALQSCKSSNVNFDMIIDNVKANTTLQKTQSDFIQTIFHNNTTTVPTAFASAWLANEWIEIATITYTGTLQKNDFFSLLNCDYGLANPNSYSGNSTTDPWFAMMDVQKNYLQYSPKMITEIPLANNNTFTIYPVPTTGVLHIDVQSNIATNAVVKVINTQGQVLKTVLMELEKGENKNEIDITDLPNASYQIQVTDGKMMSFGKMIVKQ